MMLHESSSKRLSLTTCTLRGARLGYVLTDSSDKLQSGISFGRAKSVQKNEETDKWGAKASACE
jgi:hypothetical protein